jgi:hypothetical protein
MRRLVTGAAVCVLAGCGASTAQDTPARDQPNKATDARIEHRAREIARMNGEPHPHGARIVRTSRNAMLALLGGGRTASDPEVWAVSMQGSFTINRGPPGSDPPTGNVLTLAFELDGNRVLSLVLNKAVPDLDRLGPVSDLDLD